MHAGRIHTGYTKIQTYKIYTYRMHTYRIHTHIQNTHIDVTYSISIDYIHTWYILYIQGYISTYRIHAYRIHTYIRGTYTVCRTQDDTVYMLDTHAYRIHKYRIHTSFPGLPRYMQDTCIRNAWGLYIGIWTMLLSFHHCKFRFFRCVLPSHCRSRNVWIFRNLFITVNLMLMSRH